jgi:membrane-associated phospholipid phosphatase
MNQLLKTIQANRVFFLMLFFSGILAVCISGMVNFQIHHHPVWLNIFFINYTFMGDGFFVLTIIVLYFYYFKKHKKALLLLFSFLLTEMIVQLIKNHFNIVSFNLSLEDGQYLFADETSILHFQSFPSGHTAHAFTVCSIFIMMSKNKKWQVSVFIGAVLMAVSRIYLAPHSIIDIVAGAGIGSICALLVYCAVPAFNAIKDKFKRVRFVQEENRVSPV